jgi:hypothetical protein
MQDSADHQGVGPHYDAGFLTLVRNLVLNSLSSCF